MTGRNASKPRTTISSLRSVCSIALLSTLVAGASGCAGCAERAGMTGLSLMGGTVNDPANKSLRRGMMSFALDIACKEMLKRPTALREGGELSGSATNPTNGRFFPRTCAQATADNGDLVMTFSGVGYSYVTGAHKVTFEASASVQFDQDFLMSGDVMYAYFKVRQVNSSGFKMKVIEATLPAIANQFTGFADKYGKSLMNEKIRDGFTVRRKPDSETDFRPGIVELGKWPVVSYKAQAGLVLANDRTEVHEQQRDFLGPFEITDSDQSIYLTLKIDGAPAMNVLVVDDATAKPWIEKYLTVGDATPPPGKPLGQYIVKQNEELRITAGDGNKGMYWIVLDNTGTIPGGIKPPGNFLDDRAAVASYAIVMGDKK
ncbi:MAG: hypothetical protein ACXWP4_08020 [Polyangiales bacterium]